MARPPAEPQVSPDRPSAVGNLPAAAGDSSSPLAGSRRETYPPAARVRARAEFDHVFRDGRRAATPLMTLHYLADARPPRLGLAVSRKVDRRAVVRNRIKRALRDRFRRQRAQLAPGAYVVVARSPAAQADGPAITSAFEQALRRLGALPAAAAAGTMPPASAASDSAASAAAASAPIVPTPTASASAPDRTDASSPSAP